ncbi:MAG TPA: adenylate kinase [Blastocatellia bacterium]|nr:adenylate kinase [Blastocatellia bacterium]
MKRVIVVGSTGSGKSMFAARLARLLGAPHIELDELSWAPNWTPAPTEKIVEQVAKLTEGPAWVVDGNYFRQVGWLTWPRADTLVWLDYPFRIVLWRLLLRTLRRIRSGEICCNGNRETWGRTFSNESIILWALRTYWPRRRYLSQVMTDPAYAYLQKIRFRFPREAERWLEQHGAMDGHAEFI